ncbi:MAG TPA: DUF6600 domain-containing protein, partial [Bryobacteraceae bacterium]
MRLLTLFLLPLALIAAQARYARLGDFEGTVEVQLRAADPWMQAERNLPLPESAWVRTGPASRLEIELDEGSVWRLGANSQAELSDYSRLSTGQRVTLLSLDHGLAYFTGQPEGKDALMLAVPGAQITMVRGARIRLEVQESWSQISIMEGMARFSSPAAEIDLREGQTTRVEPANPARFFLNKGVPVQELDPWSYTRDKALATSTSAAHVIERYGLADLDTAGEWSQTEDGPVWKPKAEQGWVPFQKGRWRWYDALGYTWVSDDPWGWLPYHFGRWTRMEDLGWVWVPARTAVFKPGEVYWLRGNKLAGWGPLAPGEDWQPYSAQNSVPQQFLNVNTTFAAFVPDASLIDPAGFTARPKEPLRVAAFALALPSPALAASRLDATRPELRAGSTRVTPVLDGVTFQSGQPQGGMAPTIIVNNPPAPPPVVIVTPPADPPQPVDAAYPVPVYTGILVVNPPDHPDYARRGPLQASGAPPKPQSASTGTTAPALSPGPRRDPAKPVAGSDGGRRKPEPPVGPGPITRDKKFRTSGEREIAGEVMKDVNSSNFVKALADLDIWSQRYRESDYRDDRQYYYVVAHNGMQDR